MANNNARQPQNWLRRLRQYTPRNLFRDRNWFGRRRDPPLEEVNPLVAPVQQEVIPAQPQPLLRIRSFYDLENAPRDPETGAYNLRGANLRDANLIRANLEGADLRGANLYNTQFNCANLKGAKLQDTILEDTRFVYTDLSGANLHGATLTHATLVKVNLQNANLHNTQSNNSYIENTLVYGANLTGSNLSTDRGVIAEMTEFRLPQPYRVRNADDLINAPRNENGGYNLKYADLRFANLDGVNLENSILTGAILHRTNLRGANLSNCSLSNADLYNARLQGANLYNSDLDYAILTSAKLRNANFDYASIEYLIIDGVDDDDIIDAIEARTGRPYIDPYHDLDNNNVDDDDDNRLIPGVAFEIHNAFDKININNLLADLKSNIENSDEPRFVEMNDNDFKSAINRDINIILESLSDADLNHLPPKPTHYYPPTITSWKDIWRFIYTERIINISFVRKDKEKELIGLSLSYVLKQSPAFQSNYILAYLGDVAFAYSTGRNFINNISCSKGILERFITSLVPAIDTSLTDTNIPDTIKRKYQLLKNRIEGGFDEKMAIEFITQWQEDHKNVITKENGEFRENKEELVSQQRDALIRYLCCELGITQEELLSKPTISATIEYLFGDDNIMDNMLGGQRKRGVRKEKTCKKRVSKSGNRKTKGRANQKYTKRRKNRGRSRTYKNKTHK